MPGKRQRPPVHKPSIPPIVVPRQKADREWFVAQLESLGWNASDFSLAFTTDARKPGKNPHVFGKTTRDERDCTIGEALAFAKAFNVSLSEIVTRLGFVATRPRVPVVGSVNVAGEVLPPQEGTPPNIEGPPQAGQDTRAIGISMELREFAGAWLYFHDSDPHKYGLDPRLFRGRLAVLTFKSHEQRIVGTIEGIHDDLALVVRPINSSKLITMRNLTGAHLVTWIRL